MYLQTSEQRKAICEGIIPKKFTMRERNMKVSWHKVRNDREEIYVYSLPYPSIKEKTSVQHMET